MKNSTRSHRVARVLGLIALLLAVLEVSGLLPAAISPVLIGTMTACAMVAVATFLFALMRFRR